jgi:hypothetical protein
MLIENLVGNLVDEGMGNPGSVVPIGDFSQFISAYFVHRNIVCFLIALDGNLSGHPANGSHLAPGNVVSGLNPSHLTSRAYLWQV